MTDVAVDLENARREAATLCSRLCANGNGDCHLANPNAASVQPALAARNGAPAERPADANGAPRSGWDDDGADLVLQHGVPPWVRAMVRAQVQPEDMLDEAVCYYVEAIKVSEQGAIPQRLLDMVNSVVDDGAELPLSEEDQKRWINMLNAAAEQAARVQAA